MFGINFLFQAEIFGDHAMQPIEFHSRHHNQTVVPKTQETLETTFLEYGSIPTTDPKRAIHGDLHGEDIQAAAACPGFPAAPGSRDRPQAPETQRDGSLWDFISIKREGFFPSIFISNWCNESRSFFPWHTIF